MRTVIAMIAAFALICACSNPAARQQVYGAGTARLGESLAVLGWNTSVSNLRWQDDYVLVDVDAAPTDPAKPHSDPNAAVAYAAAFPVGVLPTNESDTGLLVRTTSVAAWRADGSQLSQASLGDPAAFNGSGYMLLGLQVDTIAAKYRDDSTARGGPMMLLASPTLPPPGLNPACTTYGASVLVLPEASLDSVHLNASLCTQGDLNAALLYATVSIVGTHAAVWTMR
ncbi:hypothetical protein [Mycobacterium sp.]|uniref:hypothetical protein n=1 Tax=Mycobacterium sp. TaxID=1785 RepID=UPI003D0C7CC4